MIGAVAGAYIVGREDRRAGQRAKTARERGESAGLHRFYLLGFSDFRWTRGAGFPQLELPGVFSASQDARRARLDTSPGR